MLFSQLSRNQKYFFIFLEPFKLVLFDKKPFCDTLRTNFLITQIFLNRCIKFKSYLKGDEWAFKMMYISILVDLICYKDIMKVYFLGKRLVLHLIKSDKNCVSYYLKILTVELWLSYIHFLKWAFNSNIFRIFDGSWLLIGKCVNSGLSDL